MAPGGADVAFAWQAWHVWQWVGSGGAIGPRALCVAMAGVRIGDIGLHFAWQVLGRRWSLVTLRPFAWQAWHLVTSTFCLRGKRGTWWRRRRFCVAGVARMALGWVR